MTICRVGLIGACLVALLPAWGQKSNDLQTAPLYNFGANPYSTSTPPPVLNGPPGTMAMTPSTSTAARIAAYAQHIHGFVSAGVSSNGGAETAAGLEMPLVPGKVDLAVSGTAGQWGGLPHPPGTKAGTARYNGYQASLDFHPSDDFYAEIGVTGENMKLPNSYWR